MLKQPNSSSGLSTKMSKTISRQIINRTTNQTHNVSVQSRKDLRTLRYQSKNKSCLIPKHLAHSIESHLNSSNQPKSKKCKSFNKQYFTTECFNPNLSNLQNNIKARNSIAQSKITTPYNNFNSHILNNSKIMYPHKTFKVQPQNNKNAIFFEQNQIPIEEIMKLKGIDSKQSKNTMIKQKLLQKEIRQIFQYKTMELTRVLEEMHRFCICVKELKWICEETHNLLKKYNHEIKIYYKEYFADFNQKTDLENILKQSQSLLKRFNQLEILNAGQVPLLNFNLMANNTFFDASLANQNNQANNHSIVHQSQNKQTQSSPQNLHSWSKLIQNIHHEQLKIPHNQQPLISNDDNKNLSIRTFQITENNSPLKNKTLNQLIRVSQLRKTEFMENYATENKQNNPRWSNNNKRFKDPDQGEKRFGKRQNAPYVVSNQVSNQRDPFDSIHLPHFSSQPCANQQQQKAILQKQKYYEEQITTLKRQIQNLDIQNNEYFRKLKMKNNQLETLSQELKQKILQEQNTYIQYVKEVCELVEMALGQLINCANVKNSHDILTKKFFSLDHLSINPTNQSSKIHEPMLMIANTAFFELVHCLQQVLKKKSPQQDFKSFKTQKIEEISKKISKNTKQTSDIQVRKVQQEKNALLKQLSDLKHVKQKLEEQIIREQQDLMRIQKATKTKKFDPQDHYELSQMLFAQAFTIEQILQIQQKTIES